MKNLQHLVAVLVYLGSQLFSISSFAELAEIEPLNLGEHESVAFYHNDLVGSPVAATDINGNFLWRETYTPYGERFKNEDFNKRIGYTGHVENPRFGLVYMQARSYNPIVGRFLSVDEVGFLESNPSSFNRYAYANNNPYRYIDPDGNEPKDVTDNLRGRQQDAVKKRAREVAGEAGVQAIGLLGVTRVSRNVDDIVDGITKKKVPPPKQKSSPFGPKIADEILKNGVPGNWTKEQIRDAITDYEASIISRKAELRAFDSLGGGSETQRKAHARRISQEESFLKSLKKALKNRKS